MSVLLDLSRASSAVSYQQSIIHRQALWQAVAAAKGTSVGKKKRTGGTWRISWQDIPQFTPRPPALLFYRRFILFRRTGGPHSFSLPHLLLLYDNWIVVLFCSLVAAAPSFYTTALLRHGLRYAAYSMYMQHVRIQRIPFRMVRPCGSCRHQLNNLAANCASDAVLLHAANNTHTVVWNLAISLAALRHGFLLPLILRCHYNIHRCRAQRLPIFLPVT